MAAKITEKENLLMTLRGEQPLWVPRAMKGPDPYASTPRAVTEIGPSFITKDRNPDGTGFDIFGVEFITNETGPIHKPGNYKITDITKWRDVVKLPDLAGIDWEAMAKKDLANVNRNDTAVFYNPMSGFFLYLMGLMGFNEGLVAMYTEPDEVKALLEYICNFSTEMIRQSFHHYKPDGLYINDDTATALNPFISVEMYRELIKPYTQRVAQFAIDEGLPVEMHCCGRCEDFIEDWFDLGVCMWEPAQIVNDLVGIKKKYGNKLVISGGWDSTGPAGWPDATEEFVKGSVRELIDTFATGGGYCLFASVYGPRDAEEVKNKKRWITEEYEAYREVPYK